MAAGVTGPSSLRIQAASRIPLPQGIPTSEEMGHINALGSIPSTLKPLIQSFFNIDNDFAIIGYNCREVSDFLLRHKIKKDSARALTFLALLGNEEEVDRLLAIVPQVIGPNQYHEISLAVKGAARGGHRKLFNLLMTLHAENMDTDVLNVSLNFAAQSGYLEIARDILTGQLPGGTFGLYRLQLEGLLVHQIHIINAVINAAKIGHEQLVKLLIPYVSGDPYQAYSVFQSAEACIAKAKEEALENGHKGLAADLQNYLDQAG